MYNNFESQIFGNTKKYGGEKKTIRINIGDSCDTIDTINLDSGNSFIFDIENWTNEKNKNKKIDGKMLVHHKFLYFNMK